MKVKVIKKAWYDSKLLNEGEVIDFKGNKLPSWAESVKGQANNQKVSELPEDKKAELLAKAEAAGVTGNVDGWNVTTLQAKIDDAIKAKETEAAKLAELKEKAEGLGINVADEDTAETIEANITAKEAEITADAEKLAELKTEAATYETIIVEDTDTVETLQAKIDDAKANQGNN
jgi:hypothetical protein